MSVPSLLLDRLPNIRPDARKQTIASEDEGVSMKISSDNSHIGKIFLILGIGIGGML